MTDDSIGLRKLRESFEKADKAEKLAAMTPEQRAKYLALKSWSNTAILAGCCVVAVGQGFGGYHISGPYCALFVERVLQVVGVEKWEDLVGKHIRADGDHGRIARIGNILKEEWFDPKAEFAALKVEPKP